MATVTCTFSYVRRANTVGIVAQYSCERYEQHYTVSITYQLPSICLQLHAS